MEKLCTNKNRSYKNNEQINKQNINNSECFGVKIFTSFALTPIFEEVFFVPRRCLQKIKGTFSKGVLSIKVKWSMFDFTIIF
jgi:hypothetical protein